MHINQTIVKSLLHAAQHDNLKKIEQCLQTVPVDSTDDQSETPLHFAAASGKKEAVRCLIKKGAKLECENWCGWTPIMLASYYGHADVVKLLLKSKAKVNVKNYRLATPLTCAARSGHKHVIEVLLEYHTEINPAQDSQTSVTPLMAAAQHGHTSIVSLLLQYSVYVDYPNPDTGYTALMLAAMNGHIEIVKLLIEKGGADANLTSCLDQTAYTLSTMRQRREVELYLNERTSKSIPKLLFSEPTLIDAAKSGNLKLLRSLLQSSRNVDVNLLDSDGATPLIYACMKCHVQMVKLLLQKGAKTDIQDSLHGWTALMQATCLKRVDVVKILLNAGADKTVKNNADLTVFDLATLVGIPEITRLLAPSAPGVVSPHLLDMGNENKGNVKTWISKKMGIKPQCPQTISRVAVQRCDILNGSAIGNDMVVPEDADKIRETSSVLSAIEAVNSLQGSAKARITLVAPHVKLPDDVMAPVLPPYSKVPSFDLPKIPIMGAKLLTSNGSNDISPHSSSNGSPFLDALQQEMNNSRNLKRPQINDTSSFVPHHEPDSLQSSMTSSQFTSISQYHGPNVMLSSKLKKMQNKNLQAMEFPKHGMAWQPQDTSQFPNQSPDRFPNNQFSNPFSNTKFSNKYLTTSTMEPLLNQHIHRVDVIPRELKGTQLPSLADMSIQSVSSVDRNEDGDVALLLSKLALEKYQSTFENEEVDIDALKGMDDGDLRMMGIDRTIYREQILNAVKQKKKASSLHNIPNYSTCEPLKKNRGSVVSAPDRYLKMSP